MVVEVLDRGLSHDGITQPTMGYRVAQFDESVKPGSVLLGTGLSRSPIRGYLVDAERLLEEFIDICGCWCVKPPIPLLLQVAQARVKHIPPAVPSKAPDRQFMGRLLELSSNDPLQRSWQRGSIWSSVNE